MKMIFRLLLAALIVMLLFGSTLPAGASDKEGSQAGFTLWHASGQPAGFAGWTRQAVTLQEDGRLRLNLSEASPGSDPYPPDGYYGGNFYNGGDFWVGEAISPELPISFAFKEAIASWNAETPAGTWIETQVRARMGTRWSKWYNLGVWASGSETISRHSVRLQGDADGYVAVDTLVLTKGKVPANALQVKVRLFSANHTSSPVVRSLGLAYSTEPPKKASSLPGNPANWNSWVTAPACSQMIYADGGNVWCSPTSTSMVLGYWQILSGEVLLQNYPCETNIRAAVSGVFDWVYDGHGNWPFNTAYAASLGYEAYVVRYTSLADLEPWTKAGVPVVMSIAWKKGELTNASIPASNGHLIVLLGFDADGNAVVNDPAFPSDAQVFATYNRQELENIWQANSAGTVYLIYPQSFVPVDNRFK